jgi:predicted PurR-regulated permease PerM
MIKPPLTATEPSSVGTRAAASADAAYPAYPTYPAWARRRDVTLTLFLWVVLAVAGLWVGVYLLRPLLIVALAALLAYAVSPAVRLLARIVPLPAAIILVYLVLVGLAGVIGYLFVTNATAELATLTDQITRLLSSPHAGEPTPLAQQLAQLGLSQQQIQDLSQRAAEQLQHAAENALPLLGGVVTGLLAAILDAVLVLVLSLYFLVAGPRIVIWLGQSAPTLQRARVVGALAAVQRVLGGYLRGQLILSTLVGTLVGGGMYFLQVPYAVLLGLLAFLLEFIPTLGTVLSGVICVLVALTQGWVLALIVLGYFVLIHVLEGYVVAPRVLAKAVGLHPAVSIIALLVGAELLGVWGALFAAPAAGLLQVLLTSLWQGWRHDHPLQYPLAPTQSPPTQEAPIEPPIEPPVRAAAVTLRVSDRSTRQRARGRLRTQVQKLRFFHEVP